MAAAITTFRNVRARLSRAQDAHPQTGWIVHLNRGEARVRLWSVVPFSSQERVTCECFGQGTVARFTGAVVAQAGADLAIDILGSILYGPSTETPRLYALGLEGELEGADGRRAMRVLDVSPQSLGVSVDDAYSAATRLEMRLATEMGSVAATVEVVNCREDAESPGHFRMGINIVEMPRLDRARWGRLVQERAEA